MPGPILPTTDIKILDIDDQLGSPYGATDFSLEASYDFASTASGLGSAGIAGNFHNLAIGVGTQDKFATKIWSVWNSGVNLRVGNWGNYYHDANMILDWDISMESGFKPGDLVSIDLYFSDTNNGAGTNTFITNISLGTGQQSLVTDFNTGIPAYSTYGANTGYWIYADMSSNIPAASCFVKIPIASYGDTDGVGPDTSRSPRTSGMPTNIGGGGGGPFSGVLFGGSNIGSPIAWNKRTYFTLIISPS